MRARGWIVIAACAVTVAACASVLGLRPGKTRTGFEHRAHVTAGVTCVTCHTGILEAGDDGPLHLPDSASCVGACHQKPHDPRPCLGCHGDAFTAVAAMDAREHLTFAHKDHQQAAVGNCMRCHTNVGEGDGRMRPPMAACWGCHEHDRARDVRDCKACHVNLAEEGTVPVSHLVHEGDFVKNHGTVAASASDLCGTCHQEKFCGSCHGVTAPFIPARRTFVDPMSPSVHRAGFRSRHADEARAEPGACTSCHQPERCADCHRSEAVAGAGALSPHPPGWVGLTVGENAHGRAARRDPAACASCHGGAGEQLCVSCHAVGGVGGNPHPPGFDSALPLSAMPCRMCHPSGARP